MISLLQATFSVGDEVIVENFHGMRYEGTVIAVVPANSHPRDHIPKPFSKCHLTYYKNVRNRESYLIIQKGKTHLNWPQPWLVDRKATT